MNRRRIGVYVHIPFCQHKCSYCDFYSVVSLDAMDRFVEALCHEIRLRSEYAPEVEVATMFWGGGTPSLLDPDQFERIVRQLDETFRFSSDLEWTIEANPGTVALDKLRAYRRLGVNRISFGVQSFDDGELRFLERIHSARDAERAVELARSAGFDNINVDIMYALPGQRTEAHRANIERACALQPEHISAYSLVYEPNTPLYHRMRRGEILPLADEQEAELYMLTAELLERHGYRQYEVSNFAQPGRECRHNLLYWHRGEYLGFGPSAHSHWRNVRWSNIRSVHRYVEAVTNGTFPIAMSEQLSIEEQRNETVFLGLRADGVELSVVERLYGCSIAGAVADLIERWKQEGLATCDGTKLRLTARGYAVCDGLTVELLDVLERSCEVRQVL
jgi:oxygen-independent coproporphyrinogen-3 oxidase